MPWQSQVWENLQDQLAQERVPHALLLGGIANTGKERLAMALARLLLCHAPVAGHNCGECHACEMSRAGSHGDFRWLAPEGKSRVIKVDQIRDVVDFANKTSSLGKRKVVVFSPAESMNPNSANALLKALEEPGRDTYMLLVCHRLHGLPATIRSRCQQIRLPLPTQEESLSWLDQMTGNRSDSEKLLSLADGRPLKAEALFRGADMEAMAAVPAALDTLRQGRGTVSQVATLLGQLTIDEALEQLAVYLQRAIADEGQAKRVSLQTRPCFLLLDELTRLRGAVASGANPNSQLLLEALLARFQKELGGA
jgi:DNA polymerase-3 subunit delta'